MKLSELLSKGGNGYIIKGSKELALEYCPDCKHENYALNILSGICTWCGFDVNGENK